MAFPPMDLLPGIVAALASRFTGAHRLTVQNRRTRVRLSTGGRTHPFSEGVMHSLPNALATPEPEIMIDRAPGRQVVRQQVPGAPTPSHVEDTVEDFAAAVLGRTTPRFHRRHEWFELYPFRLGEVGIISSSRGLHLPG